MERSGTMSKNVIGHRRPDLDNRYYRSDWEANYARFLNLLVKAGKVAVWEYEPKTFLFEGVKRNPISYTPDFRVEYCDGKVEWHEVKGYMDSISRSKLKRMAQFYPDDKVVIIGAAEYRAIANWKGMIPGWE
jgi:hypothetical protein